MTAAKAVASDRKLFIAAGFLICMVLWVALLTVQHQTTYKRISETKASGLASTSVGWDPVSLWNQRSIFDFATPRVEEANLRTPAELDRRIVRQAELQVIVLDAESYHQASSRLVQQLGGYVVGSTLRDPKDSANESALRLRVPAEHFQNVLRQLQKMALRVEWVNIQAADVTKEYVDHEAILRNLRAEEAQFLAILKQARTVEETVLVTEKLLAVRGRIENTQGEFEYLRSTIALSSITVEMRSELAMRAFGVDWRPGVTIRKSFQGMLQGLANFADAMVFLLFKLPVAVLWLAVIVISALSGTKLLRRFRTLWEKRLGSVNAELH